MTFLNPAILWALAAVSIPVIIHIFNLKRTKKIEFSTLMFLKEIQQSKYKKIKLKQLLILLCRIAFVILLVLMFAKPFTKGFLGTTGEKARSSVLIILDDSFSMQSRETSGNTFDNAKAKVTETLNILDPNDEVFFTAVSQVNRLDRNMLYKDVTRLRDTLALLKTSDVTKSMNEVLFFAKEILRSASHSYKEVYIFTDGQKSFIENANVISDGLKPDEQTKLNIVLIGSRTPNNLSVDTLNTVTKIFEKNKPVKIKASVNNHNNFNVLNKSVIISFGSYKDEKAIDIPANSTVDVEFIINPGVTGFAGGFIELIQNEISDDEISSDNKQFFSFFVPEKITLLLVSNFPNDLQYINLALSSSEELMKDSLGNRLSSGSKYFEIKQVSAGELVNENLNNFNAVLIANKSQFSQGESQKLKAHIEGGGGVIIYPGSVSTAESFNSQLMRELDLPLVNGSFGNDNTSYAFDKIDFQHPIFEGIFKQGSNQKNINIESPSVRAGLNLSTGQNSIPLITLNNEKSFLVEYSKGKGRLLLFAVSPDMNSSDYPTKNLFSPITVRSILYLANINNIKPAVTGKDYFIDLNTIERSGDPADNPETDTISITVLNDAKLNDQIYISGTNVLLNLKNKTNFTANYELLRGNILYRFPANFEKPESETTKLDDKALVFYFEDRLKIEANVIKPQETISASILELRTGKDIWHYFLLAALLFIIIEYFLARSLRKSK
jgi:hypothetical protein